MSVLKSKFGCEQPAKPLNKAVYPSNTLAALAMSDEIDSRDVQGLSVGQLRDRISKLQQDTTEVRVVELCR